ncbi:hypothetical protein ACFO3J_29785 [Streptomyces polygonati]|uniref:Maltokinase n=1 Tax=Streptomyces polygonati TaxID=1617087 RepID=A0ABV8HUG6_9ACTN
MMRTADLTSALTDWLPAQRWFPAKGRPLVRTELLHCHPFAETATGEVSGVIAVVRGHFADGGPAGTYQLPLGVGPEVPAAPRPPVVTERPGLAVYDALADPDLVDRLVRRIASGRGGAGLYPEGAPPDLLLPERRLRSRPLTVEQSNTSVLVEDRYLLKVFRGLAPGTNPDLEVQRLLRNAGSRSVPRLLGALDGRLGDTRATFAVLQEYVADAEEGWQSALADVRDLLGPTARAGGRVGGDFSAAALSLGVAVARMHRELARAGGTARMTRSALVRTARQMTARFEAALAEAPRLAPYAEPVRTAYARVAGLQTRGLWPAQRVHGDLHLGQVLRVGRRWRIVDFEGEPNMPLDERRARWSPLKDVAGLLRSFDYAAHHDLAVGARPGDGRPCDGRQKDERQGSLLRDWTAHHQDAFCTGYAAVAGRDPREFGVLLSAHLLDKAVYETAYETRRRPGWVDIPLAAVARLVANIPVGPVVP